MEGARVSLRENRPPSNPSGSQFNSSPIPFATWGTSTIPAVVHKQTYNSPMPLYSMQNIAETLGKQTEILAPGVKGINFMKPEIPVNTQSAVLQAILEEEEAKRKGHSHQQEHAAQVLQKIANSSHVGVHDQTGLEYLREHHHHSPNVQSNSFRRLQKELGREGVSPIPASTSPLPQPVAAAPIRHGFPAHLFKSNVAHHPPGQVNRQQQKFQQQSAPVAQPPVPAPKPMVPAPQPLATQPQQAPASVIKPVQAPQAVPHPVAQETGPVNTCGECGRHIVGVFCRIGSRNLHSECFKCSTCGTGLKNVGYFNINDKLYCDVHAQQAAQMMSPRGTTAPSVPPGAVPAVPFPTPAPNMLPLQQPKPLGSLGLTIPIQTGTVQSSGCHSPLISGIAPAPWHQPGQYHHVDAPVSPRPGAQLLQTTAQQQQPKSLPNEPLPFAVPPLQPSRPLSMHGNTALPWGVTPPQSTFKTVPVVPTAGPARPLSMATQPSPPQQQPQQQQAAGQPWKAASWAQTSPGGSSKFTWPPRSGSQSGPSGQPSLPLTLSEQTQTTTTEPPTSTDQSNVPPPTLPKPTTAAEPNVWKPTTTQASPKQPSDAGAQSSGPPGPAGLPNPLASSNIPAPGQTSSASISTSRRGRGQKKPTPTPGTRVPICGTCAVPIRGPFIVALGSSWCQEHFLCANAQCKRSLIDVGFVEEKNQLYCETCFEQYLAPICSKCNTRVLGDCLLALSKQWHPQCFTCAYCKKAFGNNSFYMEEGLPYCEKDWSELFTTKCVGCNFPIEAGDRWVEALKNNYHSQCFKCTVCHTNLEGQSFFAKGGRPYCKQHAKG